MGLVVVIAACAGSVTEPTDAETAAETTDPLPRVATDAGTAPFSSAYEGTGAPDEEAPAPPPLSPPGEAEPDASAPAEGLPDAAAADAGNGGGGGKIPVPSFGKLRASIDTGETCAFAVDGIARGTSTVLDIALVTGSHTVTCTRADGNVASAIVVVAANQTTEAVLEFPPNGTLIATATNGTCAFAVNGSPKGTTSTLKLSVSPGTYDVACKPVGGGTIKTRTVTVASEEIVVAMFKL